jgi:hypothetical protein
MLAAIRLASQWGTFAQRIATHTGEA